MAPQVVHKKDIIFETKKKLVTRLYMMPEYFYLSLLVPTSTFFVTSLFVD